MKTEKYAKCPDCGGDGNSTCHNPDHGFLDGVISVMGANESACPCCGHSEDHKIMDYDRELGRRVYIDCETCNGSGGVDKNIYDSYLDENVPEDYIEEVNEHCLFIM